MRDVYAVFEFKIFNPRKEQTLEETAAAAVRQIEEKDYDAGLIANGIDRSRIRHYGFAFSSEDAPPNMTRRFVFSAIHITFPDHTDLNHIDTTPDQ